MGVMTEHCTGCHIGIDEGDNHGCWRALSDLTRCCCCMKHKYHDAYYKVERMKLFESFVRGDDEDESMGPV